MEDFCGDIYLNLPEEANMQLPNPTLLNYYNDLNQRTFWIDEEIGDQYQELVQYIIRINREDSLIPSESRKPIKLMIISPGGSLEITEELVSMIELSITPIYGYALGQVASGASMIYLACHKKFALPNAYFLIHKGSASNIGGDFNQIEAFMEDYSKQINEMVEFYKTHTTFDENEIVTRMKGADWYVRINEALEKGIVDELITDISIMF